jgi:hypothetical protein
LYSIHLLLIATYQQTRQNRDDVVLALPTINALLAIKPLPLALPQSLLNIDPESRRSDIPFSMDTCNLTQHNYFRLLERE